MSLIEDATGGSRPTYRQPEIDDLLDKYRTALYFRNLGENLDENCILDRMVAQARAAFDSALLADAKANPPRGKVPVTGIQCGSVHNGVRCRKKLLHSGNHKMWKSGRNGKGQESIEWTDDAK